MGKDFEIIISEKSERYNNFMAVYGTNIIKVISPFPELVSLPDSKEPVLAYFLDLDLITETQRENLICHISEKFQQSRKVVEDNLEKIGMPILAKDCTLVINNPQKYFD